MCNFIWDPLLCVMKSIVIYFNLENYKNKTIIMFMTLKNMTLWPLKFECDMSIDNNLLHRIQWKESHPKQNSNARIMKV